ncbi:hypothetical protein DEU56DRAFT_754131 [Suillus clintonianus]|uniref:uncharacterized protein n=1 Tax=Suillus clintonianus TaxID=1904413 RepID=UPI001B87AF71|nr:uncharacterized protein DEU56DRAFT_754131 [Suillus clintonianus]KAG2145275.1 hypothetical protein DEU56DRAFT_754131 [Suillus clintonianus]
MQLDNGNGFIGILSAELQSNILEEMPLPDLITFAKTRRQNQDGIAYYMAMRRTKLFMRFVDDTNALIELLDRTGTVISGSSALSLVQPKRRAIVVRDLDVYTTEKFEDEVLKHFVEKERYEKKLEVPRKTEYESTAITKIYKLQNGQKQVDVIVSDWSCTLAPILEFHSTAVMNYITARSIVCLYPRWTAANKSMINPRLYLQNKTHMRTVYVLMKYRKRGFDLSADALYFGDHLCEGEKNTGGKDGYCPHVIRSTVDDEVISWNFGPTKMLGNTTITCQDMPIMVWCLGGQECVEGDKEITLSFALVSA